MSERVMNIAVYPESGSHSVVSALNSIKAHGYNINISTPEIHELLSAHIVVITEDNVEASVFNFLISQEKVKSRVIFITPENDSLFVSFIVKKGFTDFFVFPYEFYQFIDHVKEIITNHHFADEAGEADEAAGFGNIIGDSKEMKRVIDMAKKLADKRNINILITGETGTGKGLLAKSIHDFNNDSNLPFIDITCASIPETLLESEIFGFERGAFTNATIMKQGLFELAENGTLFLDEIGEISMNIQSKLLRTLDKRVIRRLGGVADIPISARIISATNKNLEVSIENNTFRRDLFHRLNTVSIEVPPLRERGNDVLLLSNNFINHFSKAYRKEIRKIEPAFRKFILEHEWQGNVRELRNFIERAVLLCDNSTLNLQQAAESFSHYKNERAYHLFNPAQIHLNLEYEKTDLKMIEKIYAKEALNKMNGNKSRTAKVLGISRPKLDDLLNN